MYNPLLGKQEPTGEAYGGFFDELAVSSDGRLSFERDFAPRFEAFLSHYQGGLPPFEEFVNAWRHYIGNVLLFSLPCDLGACLEGFRTDFDCCYEPHWLGFHDLDLSCSGKEEIDRDQLFWWALEQFFALYQCEGPVKSPHLFGAWHHFTAISAVLYQKTAECGEYQKLGIPSFESVYLGLSADRGIERSFRSALRDFVDAALFAKGYFLPSHFFEAWPVFLDEYFEMIVEPTQKAEKLEKHVLKSINKLFKT